MTSTQGRTGHAVALLAAVAVVAGLTAVSSPAQAQTHAVAASNTATITSGSAPRRINLPKGSSFSVDLPADVRDIVVTNPEVANAMLHTHRRITIVGLTPGETDAVFVGANGRVILTLKVRVDAGVSALQESLTRTFPGSDLRVEAVNDNIVLSGSAANMGDAERAAQLARAHASSPDKVVNMISINGSDQVTLRVRVIEVQRNVIKQLGFDTNAVIGRLGDPQWLIGQAATWGINGSFLGSGSAGWSHDTTKNYQMQMPCGPGWPAGAMCPVTVNGGALGDPSNWDTAQPGTGPGSDGLNKGSATLKAFERVGLVRTLAEPNLTSVNGEAASFLAGGEFPVPASRDRDGQVSVEYKPYGVGLSFRPVVLSEGRISLQVKIEVSELNPASGLTIGAGTPSSITLPGLTVRRSDTTVELPSGGAMMIAGLLQESTRQAVDALPGMTNLPVLGSLFRSRDYQMGETELVVIVEPYIVNPTAPARMQTPADGLRIATDAQSIFFGQLNQVYGAPAPSVSGAGWQGPVGYVIE